MTSMRLWPCEGRRPKSDPIGKSSKQNRISSVSKRLFSFSLSHLIRKAEHDFYTTLPSLWISFHEILHSGLIDG